MNGDEAAWRSRTFRGNFASLAVLASIAVGFIQLQHENWWPAAPPSQRWAWAGFALLAYLLVCGLIVRRSQPRKRHEESSKSPPSNETVLIAFASQTGFAQQLAELSAENLRSAGIVVKLRTISEIESDLLAATSRVLFVVSTTGEGDPPDQALGFVRGTMGRPAALGHLRYAVLALGDREYEHFCGFGHQLDNWLRQHGARPLFDIVEVDNADESALRHWQYHLGQLGGVTDLPDWTQPNYETWTLVERRELNPGSVGESVFHLTINPPVGPVKHWVAGDIAEIGPRQSPLAVRRWLTQAKFPADASVTIDGQSQSFAALLARSQLPTLEEIRDQSPQACAENLKPLPHREYSIASLPEEGGLHILLRRMVRPDGTPGIGSGWLCDYASTGDEIAVRLRNNPNFHGPDLSKPMILIGNGTGIASLRAHLKERIDKGTTQNWLIYGERNAKHDFFYRDEVDQWSQEGSLKRLDLAFSRDQQERIYVQHKLQNAADTLREWVGAGASIYVCGSLSGMAPGVDLVLRQVLGDEEIEEMLLQGRYRRDVY